MKLTIKESSIFKKDSKGRLFRYERDITDQIKNMFDTMFTESNWGRINQHIDSGCMMISACRSENSQDVNNRRTDELASDIKSLGYGYIRILGGYIENKGTENETEVTEESFFVPKPKNIEDSKFFDDAIDLCKKYNQDSVLISLPKFTEFGYYDKNGEFDFSPGEDFIANEKQIGKYFSQLVKGSRAGKKFSFDDIKVEWVASRHPASVSQAVLMSKNGEYF